MFTGETLKQRIIVIFSFKYQEKIDQEARVDGFYALLIYKYLKRMVNRVVKHFATDEIVDTLRSMDFLSILGDGYIPTLRARTGPTTCTEAPGSGPIRR